MRLRSDFDTLSTCFSAFVNLAKSASSFGRAVMVNSIILLPLPFSDKTELELHFLKHGHKFGLVPGQEADYERMADHFMFGVMTITMQECLRPSGVDRLRLDSAKVYFGVACTVPAFVRTFYPPEATTLACHGGPFGFFRYECGRRM